MVVHSELQNPGSVKTSTKLFRVNELRSPFSAMLVKSVSWNARIRFQITGTITIARMMIVVGRTMLRPARLSRSASADRRGRPREGAAFVGVGVGGVASCVMESLLQLRLQLLDRIRRRLRRLARAG